MVRARENRGDGLARAGPLDLAGRLVVDEPCAAGTVKQPGPDREGVVLPIALVIARAEAVRLAKHVTMLDEEIATNTATMRDLVSQSRRVSWSGHGGSALTGGGPQQTLAPTAHEPTVL